MKIIQDLPGLQRAQAELPPVQPQTPWDPFIHAGEGPVPWPVFLAWLENFCQRMSWELEYDSVADESAAIFYVPPREDR